MRTLAPLSHYRIGILVAHAREVPGLWRTRFQRLRSCIAPVDYKVRRDDSFTRTYITSAIDLRRLDRLTSANALTDREGVEAYEVEPYEPDEQLNYSAWLDA